MRMRCLLLVLVAGCTTFDPYAIGEVTAADTVACSDGWCDETLSSVSSFLYGVWAVSPDDVFAVGAGGKILRRQDSTWTEMSSGTTANLHAVWAASSTDIWAAGTGGVVLRFNGAAWSTKSTGMTWDIDAIWGSSATDVWFVGAGAVMHWDGTTFHDGPVGGTLLSVSGTGSRDVWATGENTYLRHFTGGSWTTLKSTGTSTMSTVLAVGPNDLWVSDSLIGKETMHSTNGGASWTPVPAAAGGFNSMAARASNDIWAVGGRSVGQWNGSNWTITQPFGSNVSLQSVTTTPSTTAGHVWVVGGGGLIGHKAL